MIGNGGDDHNTRKELKAIQDKMNLFLSDRAKQEKVNFVGDQKQAEIAVVNEVDGYRRSRRVVFCEC